MPDLIVETFLTEAEAQALGFEEYTSGKMLDEVAMGEGYLRLICQ